MKPDVTTAVTALKFALQTERDGYRFYREAAEKTREVGGKEMFERIANDETVHEQILSEQLRSLKETGRWSAVEVKIQQADTRVRKEGPIFSPDRLAREVGDYTYELSALRMAFLIEKDSIAFYTKAAENTSDPTGRSTFLGLAEWEKTHLRALESEYHLLADQFKMDMGFAPF